MSGAAFDDAAARYDDEFTRSAVGGLQREAVHRHLLRRVLVGGESVLELGCGTGEDALFLARQGCRVLATDASPVMLRQAGEKARVAGLAGRVRLERLDLADPPASLAGGPVDLLFSNFGALNCLSREQLARLGHAAAGWVRPGGRAVLVVMPRACLVESAYFLARGRWREARRRWDGGPVEARVADGTVATWYHAPEEVEAAFAPAFRLHELRPVGLLVPPSYLDRRAAAWPRALRALAWLDEWLAALPPLAGLADHALIDLERRQAGGRQDSPPSS